MIESVDGISFDTILNEINQGAEQFVRISILDNDGEEVILDETSLASAGLSYEMHMNSEEDIQLGLTPSAQISVSLLNWDDSLSNLNFTGEFTVKIGVWVEGEGEALQNLGIFIGTRPEKTHAKQIELVGLDRMQLFEVDAEGFFSQEPTGRTLAQYFTDLCAYVGVTPATIPSTAVNTAVTYDTHPTDGKGMSCRKVLGLIAEAMGCYALFNRDGECELRWFTDHTSDYTIERDTMRAEPEIAGYAVPAIQGMMVENSKDGSLVRIAGGNPYWIINNPFFNVPSAVRVPMASAFYAVVQHLTSADYFPLMVENNGTWLVEPGDVIGVVALAPDGSEYVTYELPVFSMTLQWAGSAVIALQSTGNPERGLPDEIKSQAYSDASQYYKALSTRVEVFTSATDPATTEDGVKNGDIWIKESETEGGQQLAYIRANGVWVNVAWDGQVGTEDEPWDIYGTLHGKLGTARTIRTNLASTAAASFDGSKNVTPGVTGTLPIANGGTGLTESPSMLANLGSTTAANVLAASPRPGITGTLPITHGGTGSTSAPNARTALGVPADDDVVHNTGAESVAGAKTFTNNPIIKPASRYKYLYFRHNTASNGDSGYIRVDAGNATNQTANRFAFAQYSPKSTAGTDNTGFCEIYYLPVPAKGLDGNVSYSILTTNGPEFLQVKEYTYKYTANANAYLSITGTNLSVSTPSGYTPLCFKSVTTGSTGVAVIAQNSAATGSSTVIGIRNLTSSAITQTLTVNIVYVRSTLV